MTNIQRHLSSQGLDFDDLVSTVIYLKDMRKFDHLNEIYQRYFKKRFPTRICIAVADLPGGASVKISGIAELKTKKRNDEKIDDNLYFPYIYDVLSTE